MRPAPAGWRSSKPDRSQDVHAARWGIQHADAKRGPMVAAVSARMGTTMNGIVDNQMILAQVAQQVNARMGLIDAKVNHARAGARGNRGGGLPTLQPTVRPGP